MQRHVGSALEALAVHSVAQQHQSFTALLLLTVFYAGLELQDTLSYTGQQEQAAHQISFHPTDPNLLCSLGAAGLSLWSIDGLRNQDEMRQVPVQMPG